MSQEAATRFKEAVSSNEVLRRELEAQVTTDAQLVAFAVGHGYQVTADELRADTPAVTELGDGELGGVAGGFGQLVACDGASKQPVARLSPSSDWYAAFMVSLRR